MTSIAIYEISKHAYTFEPIGAPVYEIPFKDARTAHIVYKCLSAFYRGPHMNAEEFLVAKRVLDAFRVDPYAEQYPDSGYAVELGQGGNLSVRCPMHGVFEISEANFLYHRGCSLCRGVHPRAHPVRSSRKWTANPVFINRTPNGLEVSRERGDVAYGVGYSDKRVAELVEKTVNKTLPHNEMFTLRIMTAAATFKVKQEYLKRTVNTSRKAVFIEPRGKGYWVIGKPDTLFNKATIIAFYHSRLYAEFIYHIACSFGSHGGNQLNDLQKPAVETLLYLTDQKAV